MARENENWTAQGNVAVKRKSYSLHFVPSVFHGQSILVRDRLTYLLIAWAETTPGMRSFAVGTPRFAYQEDGEDRETGVSLSVRDVTGATAYWDAAWVSKDGELPRAHAVKEAHARHDGVQYRLFTTESFARNRIELKNRQAAHTMLYQGRRLDTQDLETSFLMRLADGATSVEALAREAGTSVTRAMLACLRMHTKGRAVIPMDCELMSPRWLAERAM